MIQNKWTGHKNDNDDDDENDDDDALCTSFCFQADYISRVPHAAGGFPNGCPCLSP